MAPRCIGDDNIQKDHTSYSDVTGPTDFERAIGGIDLGNQCQMDELMTRLR